MIGIPNTIETTATICEVLCLRTCHAVLPNGKPIFAFTSKDLPCLPLSEGTNVRVRMNVADFSRGEMTGVI